MRTKIFMLALSVVMFRDAGCTRQISFRIVNLPYDDPYRTVAKFNTYAQRRLEFVLPGMDVRPHGDRIVAELCFNLDRRGLPKGSCTATLTIPNEMSNRTATTYVNDSMAHSGGDRNPVNLDDWTNCAAPPPSRRVDTLPVRRRADSSDSSDYYSTSSTSGTSRRTSPDRRRDRRIASESPRISTAPVRSLGSGQRSFEPGPQTPRPSGSGTDSSDD